MHVCFCILLSRTSLKHTTIGINSTDGAFVHEMKSHRFENRGLGKILPLRLLQQRPTFLLRLADRPHISWVPPVTQLYRTRMDSWWLLLCCLHCTCKVTAITDWVRARIFAHGWLNSDRTRPRNKSIFLQTSLICGWVKKTKINSSDMSASQLPFDSAG